MERLKGDLPKRSFFSFKGSILGVGGFKIVELILKTLL